MLRGQRRTGFAIPKTPGSREAFDDRNGSGFALPAAASMRRSAFSSGLCWIGDALRMTVEMRRQFADHVRRIAAQPQSHTARTAIGIAYAKLWEVAAGGAAGAR